MHERSRQTEQTGLLWQYRAIRYSASGGKDLMQRNVCYTCRSGLFLRNYYGGGSGPVWLNNLYCTGNELSLVECRHSGWGAERSCRHYEHVSVICAPRK